jgi:hypothetical protein
LYPGRATLWTLTATLQAQQIFIPGQIKTDNFVGRLRNFLAAQDHSRIFFFGFWSIGICRVSARLAMGIAFAMGIDFGFNHCARSRTYVGR